MTVVDGRVSVWEALAGREPGRPLAAADPNLWALVADRINPAKARPVLRQGIEEATLVGARGTPYVMLRSPSAWPRNARRAAFTAADPACYLRLAPDEVVLAHLMDGSRTVARLVAEFARISGRLAPDQVRRVVADLAANRMLEELPVDAFAPLERVRQRPWPARLVRGLLAVIAGRRFVLANIDPLVSALYRGGGRLLFTGVAGALMAAVAAVGAILFIWQWFTGAQSIFLTRDSYLVGAIVLLGLNVVALACHEVGHALAAKHAGRRVPAAGLLVYFGIPSVFVDTTDVWMAGRRARMLTTLAGPATGFVLAGAAALVAVAVPAAAPWCFKLCFAWYLNALFNLNPFLALDGYYLLMDWLELPNLRARGLAWVAARARRRPPSWSALDREGRLVALYGVLATLWLLVALNVAYRVYLDRVGGLITGLWHSGVAAKLLLALIVAALISPLLYVAGNGLARRWRRLRQRLAEGRTARDVPRRLDVLRSTPLRDLPEPAMARLAALARWVRPRSGEQLILAGATHSEVFTVVDGALEARAPGDPIGTVRARIGPGGLVGLGPALSGTASPLAWYAAGTRLLALPSSAVVDAVGPRWGSADADFASAAAAQALFGESPALRGLSDEDRAGLALAAVPVSLAPGEAVNLASEQDALVVSAGVVVTPDGQELGRGTLIGPAGTELAATVARARSAVSLFRFPAVAGLPLLLGAGPSGSGSQAGSGSATPANAGRTPVYGVHPPAAYPPLAVPPGPPPASDGTGVDEEDRFERRMWALVVLVGMLAVMLTATNAVLEPLTWAEMPSDRALLHVERSVVTGVVDGAAVRLTEGDDIYVGERDEVRVPEQARARLTFRGGASSLLCAGTVLSLGAISSAGRPVAPIGTLALHSGVFVAATGSGSPAFSPLVVTLLTPLGTVINDGPAVYAVGASGVSVATGVVSLNGAMVTPVAGELGCGDGAAVVSPTGTATMAVGPTPSVPASPSVVPTIEPSPSTSSTPTTSPTPTATAPVNPFPVIHKASPDDPVVYQPPRCDPTSTTVHIEITDSDSSLDKLHVDVVFQIGGKEIQSGQASYVGGAIFDIVFGPITNLQLPVATAPVDAIVKAADPDQHTSTRIFQAVLKLSALCVIGIGTTGTGPQQYR